MLRLCQKCGLRAYSIERLCRECNSNTWRELTGEEALDYLEEMEGQAPKSYEPILIDRKGGFWVFLIGLVVLFLPSLTVFCPSQRIHVLCSINRVFIAPLAILIGASALVSPFKRAPDDKWNYRMILIAMVAILLSWMEFHTMSKWM